MKLKLHEIKETVSLTFSENEGWVREIFRRLKQKFEGPLALHLKVSSQDDNVFVEGHLKVTISQTCSRCASGLSFEIDEFFSPVFIHGKDPSDADGSVDRSELDSTYFQGDEFDLAEVVYEQLILLTPSQPLCREDCRGLCAQCGHDLNLGPCDCEKEVPHTQFDVLKRFKVKKKGH